jgi:signal transduction histidine kinase/CheY-like chemotaxis protein
MGSAIIGAPYFHGVFPEVAAWIAQQSGLLHADALPSGPFKRVLAWFEPPALADEDDTRRARLLSRVILVMMVLAAIGCVAGVVEQRNDLRITLSFYGVVWAWLIGMGVFVRRGHVKLAAWVLSILFWLMIALVTLLFGGLKAQNATAFAVCILLLGGVVGGRAAFSMALASAGWCGFVAWLELSGKLPAAVEPYSPINAWAAVTITVLLTSVLLRTSLESLERMHVRAEQAARERDEALRRSIQGQKMELVGNLTSGIAHDFNNLLTVMRSVSDVLRQELPHGSTSVTQLLDDLDDATSRATLMTRQVLSFGRTAISGPETLDLSAVVLELQGMLPRLVGPNIDITVHAPLGANIEASRAAIEQILLNLVVNSREAMPQGGCLNVSVETEASRVVLITEDTGVGMDEATQQRLFEPFFTTKSTGTGLGLATVRELTERFAGTISVQSSRGQGSRFELRFPRSSVRSEIARTGQTDRPPAVVPPLRLLLVEDDALVRRSLCRWLNAEGFEVSSANDGREALAMLDRSHDIACVISDISMPHLDGEQLATELSAHYPGLPLVLVSGDRAPLAGVLTQGKRAFVPKPLSQRALTEAIAQVLST